MVTVSPLTGPEALVKPSNLKKGSRLVHKNHGINIYQEVTQRSRASNGDFPHYSFDVDLTPRGVHHLFDELENPVGNTGWWDTRKRISELRRNLKNFGNPLAQVKIDYDITPDLLRKILNIDKRSTKPEDRILLTGTLDFLNDLPGTAMITSRDFLIPQFSYGGIEKSVTSFSFQMIRQVLDKIPSELSAPFETGGDPAGVYNAINLKKGRDSFILKDENDDLYHMGRDFASYKPGEPFSLHRVKKQDFEKDYTVKN